MVDLLKASDFGVVSHITANLDFNTSYNTSHFYKISRGDILQKISSLSCDLDERDFELAIAKPLLPVGFKIKPSMSVPAVNSQSGHRQVKPNIQTPVASGVFVNNQDDDNAHLEQIILKAQKAANQADDLSSLKVAINNFESTLESQKFALKTLAYHDAETVDILWINNSISSDEDKLQGVMSDSMGQMIVNLFDYLGYGRNNLNLKKQVGYTALSFWAIPFGDTQEKKEYQVCLPFVKRLIYLLNPKKIILSGNVPLHYVLQVDNVFKNHGKKFSLAIDDKTFDCYSVFSVPYILRSEITKKIFWFDLLKILHDND
jgi:uracil-DNA glycosylase